MKWLLIALIVIPGTIADVLNTMGMKLSESIGVSRGQMAGHSNRPDLPS